MTQAIAIAFDAPSTLSVKTLGIKPSETDDLKFEVNASGVSTETERLLCDRTMPHFPGHGYSIVPGHETLGTVVRVAPELAPEDVLMALAAICYHAVSFGGARSGRGYPCTHPDDYTRKKYVSVVDVSGECKRGAQSLAGLITHTFEPGRARGAYEVAFNDPQRLKMKIDWNA